LPLRREKSLIYHDCFVVAQAYVDQNLMCALDAEGTTLSSAALVGHDGGVWAQSSNFPAITTEETASILSILSRPGEIGSFTVGGVKYMVGLP